MKQTTTIANAYATVAPSANSRKRASRRWQLIWPQSRWVPVTGWGASHLVTYPDPQRWHRTPANEKAGTDIALYVAPRRERASAQQLFHLPDMLHQVQRSSGPAQRVPRLSHPGA